MKLYVFPEPSLPPLLYCSPSCLASSTHVIASSPILCFLILTFPFFFYPFFYSLTPRSFPASTFSPSIPVSPLHSLPPSSAFLSPCLLYATCSLSYSCNCYMNAASTYWTHWERFDAIIGAAGRAVQFFRPISTYA